MYSGTVSVQKSTETSDLADCSCAPLSQHERMLHRDVLALQPLVEDVLQELNRDNPDPTFCESHPLSSPYICSAVCYTLGYALTNLGYNVERHSTTSLGQLAAVKDHTLLSTAGPDGVVIDGAYLQFLRPFDASKKKMGLPDILLLPKAALPVQADRFFKLPQGEVRVACHQEFLSAGHVSKRLFVMDRAMLERYCSVVWGVDQDHYHSHPPGAFRQQMEAYRCHTFEELSPLQYAVMRAMGV